MASLITSSVEDGGAMTTNFLHFFRFSRNDIASFSPSLRWGTCALSTI